MSSPHSVMIRCLNLATVCSMIFFTAGCSKNAEQLARIKQLEQELQDQQSANESFQRQTEELEKTNSEFRVKITQIEQELKFEKNKATTAQQELETLRKAKAAEEQRAISEAPAKKLAAVKSGFDQQLAAIFSIEGDVSKGRGVVIKTDGKTWLYSSARIFSGNTKLAIKTPSGTAVTKFGEFQIAMDSPICRLEIQQEMPASFEIAPTGTVENSVSFITAVPSPETGTMQAIECLSTDSAGNEFGLDAINNENSSGCPVASTDTGKLVAIFAQAAPPVSLWPDSQAMTDALPRAHRINRAIEWKKSTITAFLSEHRKINEINATTRLLQALALIRANSNGLLVDALVAGTDISVLQILEQNASLPLVVELKKLHADLSGKGVRLAERDISRRLTRSLEDAASIGKRQVQDLKAAPISPYHKPLAEQSLKWRADADQAVAAMIASLPK